MDGGKRICKALKELRKRIADANGIPYEIEDCPYAGPCPGTCPRCEAEVRYLEEALDKKRERGEGVKIKGLMTEEELTLLVNNHNGIDIVTESPRLMSEPAAPPEDTLREKLKREIHSAVMDCISLAKSYQDIGLFINETDNAVLCVREPGREVEALFDYLKYDWRELLEDGLPSKAAISRLADQLMPKGFKPLGIVSAPQDGEETEWPDARLEGLETEWPERPLGGEETARPKRQLNGLVSDWTKRPIPRPRDFAPTPPIPPKPTPIKQVLTPITVAGTSHVKNIEELAEDICKGVELAVRRDVFNKHDVNAIALYLGDQRIGYVPKQKNEILANLLAAGTPLIAVVTASEWRGSWLQITADIALPE